MRRALITVFASAVVAAGLSFAAPAPAEASGYDHGYDRGRYDNSCRCYRGRELGYWERPSDRRWNRHHHRRYRQPQAHYYPGYGYYPSTGHGRYDRHDGHHGRGHYDRGHHGRGHYDRGRHGRGHYDRGHEYGYGHDRDRSRSAWCARTYRSYDWRSGTYMTYDGRRVYCG